MQNKFILKTTDDFQVDAFLSKLEKDNTGYQVKRYYDVFELQEKLSSHSMFDDDKEIAVLMSLDSEAVKVLGSVYYDLEECILVLVQRSSIPKTKYFSNFVVDFEVKSLETLNSDECERWVASALKSRGLLFSKDVPKVIVSIVGNNMYALLSEAEKLELGAVGVPLDGNNIRNFISYDSPADNFVFMDHLTHKRVKEALLEFNQIDPSSYAGFVSFLISQLERYYKISIFRAQNYTAEEIAELVGIPAFILKTKIYPIYTYTPKTKILKAIDLLLELSLKLRQSPFNNKLLFEYYLLKILKN